MCALLVSDHDVWFARGWWSPRMRHSSVGAIGGSQRPINPVPSLGQSRLRRPTDTCKVPLAGVSLDCVTTAGHELIDNVAWVPSHQRSNEIALTLSCIK